MNLRNRTHYYLGFICLLYGLQVMKLKEEKARRLEILEEKIAKIKTKIKKRLEEIKKKISNLK